MCELRSLGIARIWNGARVGRCQLQDRFCGNNAYANWQLLKYPRGKQVHQFTGVALQVGLARREPAGRCSHVCNIVLSSGWRTFSLFPIMGKIEKLSLTKEKKMT